MRGLMVFRGTAAVVVAIVLLFPASALVLPTTNPSSPLRVSEAGADAVGGVARTPASLVAAAPLPAPTAVAGPTGSVLSAAAVGSLPRTADSAGSSESTLALLNDSVHAGLFSPQQEVGVSALAFDPALDVLFVAANFPIIEGLSHEFVSVVDPATHEVVGAIATPGCASWSDTGLVYDPNTGLLYDSCSNGNWTLAIDPVSGSIVANVSLGGYAIGPDCAGFQPQGLSLAVVPQLDDIFAIVEDCRTPANPLTSPLLALTLSVVDDRTDAIVGSISLGATEEQAENYWYSEPMAFDPLSGQLYVSVVPPNPTGLGESVSIIDPLSGHVVSTMFIPVENVASGGLADLLFSSGAGAVITSGLYLPSTGSSFSAVVGLDPLKDQVVPIIVLGFWKSCTTAGSTCGLYVSPDWLSAGPGTGPNVTVSANDLNRDYYGLIYNMTDVAEVANVSLGPSGFGVFDAIDHEMFFPDWSNECLDTMVGSPPQIGAPVPLGLVAYSEAIDPTTGTVYVATGSLCGSSDFLLGLCRNETVDIVPLVAERPVASWAVTAGIAAAMIFDPLNQRIYVFSECALWSYGQPNLPCLPGQEYAALTAYSTSGQWLAESVLSSRFPSWVPEGMAIDSATGAVLVMMRAPTRFGAMLDIFNPSTAAVEGNVTLAGSYDILGSVTYDPQDNLVFAYAPCQTEPVRQCLWAYDGSTYAPVWNVTLPTFETITEGLAFDSLNDTLLVASNDSVLTVDPTNGAILGEQLEDGTVGTLSYDPASNVLYLTAGSDLSEENASNGALLRTLPLLPGGASYLAVDSASGVAAVAQSLQGSVVFAPGTGPAAYPVEFEETGLPASIPWTVTVGGITQTASGPISVFLPNGTYAYSIAPVPGFEQSSIPSTGTIIVSGSAVLEPTASYGLVTYAITFAETGAADPSGWYVTLVQETGYPNQVPCGSCLGSPSAQSILGSNGTYRYVLEGQGTGYQLTGIAPSGTISVSGAPVTLDFGFVQGPTPSITFQAAGTSGDARWCVVLASIDAQCTTARSLRFTDLTPATYAYTISPPAGFAVTRGSGSVVLGSSSVSVTAKFVPRDYLVTFVEVGLVAPTHWKVEVDGKIVSGARPFLTLELPNGTYDYSAPPVRGYTGTWSGEVTVDGAAVAVDGTFVPVLYAVTFSEIGLPSGTNWSVTIRGVPYHSTSSTIVVDLANGTYAYKVGAISGFTRSSAPAQFKVNGAPVPVSVTFRAKGSG